MPGYHFFLMRLATLASLTGILVVKVSANEETTLKSSIFAFTALQHMLMLFTGPTFAADRYSQPTERLNTSLKADTSYRSVVAEKLKIGSPVVLFLRPVKPVNYNQPLHTFHQYWGFIPGETIEQVDQVNGGTWKTISRLPLVFERADLRQRYLYTRGLQIDFAKDVNRWDDLMAWQNGPVFQINPAEPYCRVQAYHGNTEKVMQTGDFDIELKVITVQSMISSKANTLSIGLANESHQYQIECVNPEPRRFTLGTLEDLFAKQIYFGDWRVGEKSDLQSATLSDSQDLPVDLVRARIKFLKPIPVGFKGSTYLQSGRFAEFNQLVNDKSFCRIERTSWNPLQGKIAASAAINASIVINHSMEAGAYIDQPGVHSLGTQMHLATAERKFWSRVRGMFAIESDEFSMTCMSSHPTGRPNTRDDLREATAGLIDWN